MMNSMFCEQKQIQNLPWHYVLQHNIVPDCTSSSRSAPRPQEEQEAAIIYHTYFTPFFCFCPIPLKVRLPCMPVLDLLLAKQKATAGHYFWSNFN